MQKQQFMQDLQVIYDELQSRQATLNSYYDVLDESKTNERAVELVDAFLKLLEEPPSGVKFILVALSKYLLLDTILSRVAIKKITFNNKTKKNSSNNSFCGIKIYRRFKP